MQFKTVCQTCNGFLALLVNFNFVGCSSKPYIRAVTPIGTQTLLNCGGNINGTMCGHGFFGNIIFSLGTERLLAYSYPYM